MEYGVVTGRSKLAAVRAYGGCKNGLSRERAYGLKFGRSFTTHE